MSNPKVQAVARVQITVEFAVGQAWPSEASVETVHAQAHDAAIDILRRGLAIDGLVIDAGKAGKTKAEIVGTPTITAILVTAQS